MKPSGPCSLFSIASALFPAARTQQNRRDSQRRHSSEAAGGELPKPEACELRPSCEWAGAEILRLVPSNRNLKTTGLDEDLLLTTCCFAPSVSPPAEGTVARTGWNWSARRGEKKRHYNLPLILQQRRRGRRGLRCFSECVVFDGSRRREGYCVRRLLFTEM